MTLTAAASGFVIFLLSVQVIQGQYAMGVTYTFTEMCVLKGSTVDIRCTYRYPLRKDGLDTTVEKTFWFTKMKGAEPVDLRTDSEYSGRVQYHCDKNNCTLRITDLRESDSAVYKFRFITNQSGGRFTGLPGVSLTVTALQVQVITITVHQSCTEAELKCLSSCSPAGRISYIWFKNGQKVMNEETSLYSGQFNAGDNVSCALKGHEDYSSPSVYAPMPPSVSVSPSDDIIEGSSVTLTCSSDANPAANYNWYKKNENPDLQPLSKEPQLIFSSIQSSDSGEYYCTAENQLGKRTSEHIFINVKYGPKPPSVSVSPSGEIVQGSSVTLNCSSDANPAATYTWHKENQTVLHGPENMYHFTSISSEDSGVYHCKSENQYGEINSSSLIIDVQYAPKLPSVSVSPSGEIVEGSSVTLTCSSDANPAAKYTWYKKNVNPDLQPLSKEPQLVFSSIQSSDSGEYYCTAENQLGKRTSEFIFIDVKYAPKVPSVSVSPSSVIVEGSSVTLTCSSDANPATNYTWYKENQTVTQGQQGSYHFTSIRSEDSGIYHCKSENQYRHINSSSLIIDVQYAPKVPSVSVRPSGEIVEGSSVTLTCSSEANPAANYTWYKESQTVTQGQQGSYHFTSISSEDSGIYHCKSENQYGQINSSSLIVDVQYAPKLPSVSVSPSDAPMPPSVSVSPSSVIVEGSSVTLTCNSDANPATNYTWYKENQTVTQGQQGSYHFTSIRSEDSGIYHCKSENQYRHINSSSLIIDVQYAPKLPSVSVRPSREIVEGSSVTLTCSSDANPAANYTWYKENQTVTQGQQGSYHFTSISSEDSGIYHCKSENQYGQINSSSLIVDVQYAQKLPPVSVSPSGEIVEGSSVNLTCSSDANPAANYTWYKENQTVTQGQQGSYHFTSISSEDSGIYHCKSENQYGQINSSSLIIDVQCKYKTLEN
ncbi:sialoadhesin-like [Thunnus thynnus]|uniref:sialoadhesin-like n=1 Tax=Thunnus thynnus TaxID=8237 RepID=UPI003528F245